jgi:hypothetical protein
VRVVGQPDLSSVPEPDELETRRVFAHLVGAYKKIVDFDDFGFAELAFRIRSGPAAGSHSVWIEPYLLRSRRRRQPDPAPDARCGEGDRLTRRDDDR